MIRILKTTEYAKRGFTLFELLVAITILGLISFYGAELFHLGGRSWERMTARSSNVAAIESVQSLLRMELSRAQLMPLKQNDKTLADFSGNTTELTFQSQLPEALDANGPTKIRLTTETVEHGQNLVLEWYDKRNGEWQKSTLIKTIGSLHFDYFGGDKGTISHWQDIWQNRSNLPQAVKITVAFPTDDQRIWPALIINPMITTDIAFLHSSGGMY